MAFKQINMITSIDQLNFEADYTYSDYLLWQFQERVELLRGKLSKMAAPNLKHQQVSGNLYFALRTFFNQNPCFVFVAPFDVRLPLPPQKVTHKKLDTVVQPDLCVICDKNKLDQQGGIGAPDLVVEILSPGNSKKEMRDKYEIYESAGVREYWIVYPDYGAITVYYLDDRTQKFISTTRPFAAGDTLTSHIFPNLNIALSEIFTF